tara:strand:- start:224 stop:370 length:147 start_codon:yes stop_codon:yes gene_type:complete
MDKFNIRMDDGTEIDTLEDLGKELEEIKRNINDIKYFLRNPKKYQKWD